MNTKHTTKGPWFPVDYAGEWQIQNTSDYTGNNILDEEVYPNEAEANAKLMAAAPELLMACITAKALLEAQGINEDSRIGGKQYMDICIAISSATE